MKEQNETKKRGGAREGAGRKRFGTEKRVTIAVTVPPSVRDTLRSRAEAAGISVSELVTRLAQAL